MRESDGLKRRNLLDKKRKGDSFFFFLFGAVLSGAYARRDFWTTVDFSLKVLIQVLLDKPCATALHDCSDRQSKTLKGGV